MTSSKHRFLIKVMYPRHGHFILKDFWLILAESRSTL